MSIQYNVSTLVREPVGFTREHDVDDDVLIDVGQRQHVTGHTTLLRTMDGVLVTADLDGVDREACSRCLRNTELRLHMSIREEYLATVDAETGALLPAAEEPEAFRIDASHMLNIEEAVRQAWTSALPMQPLCRQDCDGLCGLCGKDLNQGACSCLPEPDERWTALAGLARDMEGK